MERVNSVKPNLLLVLIPNHLGHATAIEQDIVNYGNNLLLEICFLTHVVIKPPLGRNGDRSQLLAHGYEAGKNVVANRAIDEAGFQLLNGSINQLNVKIGGGRPRLDLAANAKVTGLIKQPLAVLPAFALV
ncbi:MAG: hypothetical protein EB116_08870 [Betaproteobacteria bacterium]|nr:hypothetical protein [Betaproteobacteria bacterium]